MMKKLFIIGLCLFVPIILLARYVPFGDTGGQFEFLWTVGVNIDVQLIERETTPTIAFTPEATLATTSTATMKATELVDPFLENAGIPASEVLQGLQSALEELKPEYAEIFFFSNGMQTFNFNIHVRTTESWVIGEINYTGPATPISITTGSSWKSFQTTRGKRLFYESVAGTLWERVATEKFLTGNFQSPFRLTYNPSLDEYPSFDPSGEFLAFISDRIGGNRNIHVLNFNERRIMNFPVYGSSEYFPRFSPNGQRILFQGTMYGQWDIFTMPFSTNYASGIRLLTRNLPNAYTPCWYDDRTALVAVDKGNGSDIYSIDIHTGESRNLTQTPGVYEMYPCRVATEDAFIYVKLKEDGSYGIFERISLESTTSTETEQPFLDTPFNEFDPYISSSGRFIVYSANTDPESPIYRIWIKDLITGESTSVSQALPYDCYYPTISPDDRYVVFAAYYSEGEPDLWVVENPLVKLEETVP